jgi:hypothetical protein
MFNALGDESGKNDTDGFVLAAQSGQSQGWSFPGFVDT